MCSLSLFIQPCCQYPSILSEEERVAVSCVSLNDITESKLCKSEYTIFSSVSKLAIIVISACKYPTLTCYEDSKSITCRCVNYIFSKLIVFRKK